MLTRSTGTNTYDIFVCGYQSMLGDNFEFLARSVTVNMVTTPYSGYARNKDMWVMSVPNTNLYNPHFTTTYDESSHLNLGSVLPEYNSTGPVTARGMLSDTYNDAWVLAQSGFTNTQTYLKASANVDERASDMLIDASGNIVVIGLTNYIAIRNGGSSYDNGASVFITDGSNSPAVHNLIHSGTNVEDYFGYIDGDGYLLQLNSASGIIQYAKNVAHFSSRDFAAKIVEKNGNIIAAGSLTDRIPSTNPDYAGLTEPYWYDALLFSTPNADNTTGHGDHNWRRNFHDYNEEGICNFALARTADGGFVIGGDNNRNRTNFSVTKLASECASKPS